MGDWTNLKENLLMEWEVCPQNSMDIHLMIRMQYTQVFLRDNIKNKITECKEPWTRGLYKSFKMRGLNMSFKTGNPFD
jgi:hypothetical protein